MNEVKKPKRPLLFYWGIALAVLLLINFLLVPRMSQRRVQDVDYGTFMTMTEENNIGQVEVQEQQILFTDKSGENIYRTGRMDDPGLTERLHHSDAKFAQEIVEETSPWISFLLSWIIPILLFYFMGRWLSRQLMKKAGGGNSMMFNLGKSNAKYM